MTREELIYDIKERFKITSSDLKKGLPDYELELVYKVYPNLPKRFIDRSLLEFKYEGFKPKAPQREPKEYIPPEGRFKGITSGKLIIGQG